MGEASTFRTAAPAVDTPAAKPMPTGDPTGGSTVSETSLFATYETDQKKPYVAHYLELDGVWDKEPSLARDIKEIEGYIRSQVEAKKIDNSTKAAAQYLKELERKAGLSRYESTPQRIQKILAYVDFQKVVNS